MSFSLPFLRVKLQFPKLVSYSMIEYSNYAWTEYSSEMNKTIVCKMYTKIRMITIHKRIEKW